MTRSNERGFSYIMVMIAVVVMGVAMSAAARQWKTMVQRELEADLLAKGIEIQNALALYSTAMKAGRVMPGEVYPATLADLTRQPKPFLRKVYSDPISHGEWDLIRAPTGGIMGVRSKSKGKPIKEKNFPLAVRHFEGRPTYADWMFQHPNPSSGGGLLPTGPNSPLAPGQQPQPGGPPASIPTGPNAPPQGFIAPPPPPPAPSN
ncbi:prepilin-type N-terminal cleavage/methylation domain-containing protein [Nitrospira moscoviensis]|uniref:Type II secretion system protein n=1 Tax=Nitrospira moscoviensis TaxID=42253 RepID=A0A0K2GFM4_NITMO|nr:prepilin-type N-terminal cleavage/methylation domain-containing protein [Nitrospira moscoviensis]ALA59751.1 conserved exported protein of unknown function [Nitrospira moscoviensis]